MFKLIRPKNLLLIALLQILVLIRLGDYDYLLFDINKTLALLLSTMLVAAAGYIINDYFDVKIDMINKPDEVIIGQGLPRRWAIILHIGLSLCGLALAYTVNLKTLSLTFLCALLLYIYSSSLKKRFLTGNLVIAILSTLCVYICQCYIGVLNETKIFAYGCFAGVSTLLREIVKDVEDEKGDALFQSNSLAINLGMRRTKIVILFTSLLLLVAVITYPFIALRLIYTDNFFFRTYALLLLAGVGIPLILFTLKLKSADKKSDFAYLSRLIKIIMLIGIFSILFS